MTELVNLNDQRGFTNNDIVEYIMQSNRIRGYFNRLTKSETSKLVQALTSSSKCNSGFDNKEACIRLISHLLFSDNEFDDGILTLIYSSISKLAFDNPAPTPQFGK